VGIITAITPSGSFPGGDVDACASRLLALSGEENFLIAFPVIF
jgi:hypothetical protein